MSLARSLSFSRRLPAHQGDPSAGGHAAQFGPIQARVAATERGADEPPDFPDRLEFLNANLPPEWVRLERTLRPAEGSRCEGWHVHIKPADGQTPATLASLMRITVSETPSVLARETTFFLPPGGDEGDSAKPVRFTPPPEATPGRMLDALWRPYTDEAEIEFNFDGEWQSRLRRHAPIVHARLTSTKCAEPKDGFDTLLRFHNVAARDQWVKVERFAPGSAETEGGRYAGRVTVPPVGEAPRGVFGSAEKAVEPTSCKFRTAKLRVAYFELAADESGASPGMLCSLDTEHPQVPPRDIPRND